MPRSAPYEKSKFLGSGGSMVARLKLKEIDGRAPDSTLVVPIVDRCARLDLLTAWTAIIADLQPLQGPQIKWRSSNQM
jgi:hypothetical protein